MKVNLLILVAAAVIIATTPCPAQEKDKRGKALDLCKQGEALISAGKVEEALKNFKEALDVDIKCIQAHKRYQDILMAMGERDKLLTDYRDFLQIKPNSAMFNYLYSRLHSDDLDIEQKYLRKATQLDPKFFDARLSLGISFLSGKQYREALEQLQECEKIRPKDPITKFRMADVYLKLGKYDEARACYGKVERDMPGSPVVQYAMGCSYAYQGDHAEAVNHFRKADKLGFVDKTFYIDWAQSCLGLGKQKEAIGVYEKLFETDASPEDFARIEQEILRLSNPYSDLDPAQKEEFAKAIQMLEGEPAKPAQALAALDALAKKVPGSEAVHHMRGRALLVVRKNKEAASAFEKAAQLNSEYPAPIVYLAMLDYFARKHDSAMEKLLKALALDPFNAEANMYAAVILYNLEKYKDALKYAKRAYLRTGSTREVGDIFRFAELYLEDESLYLDEFEVGAWKVTVYKGMPQVDPRCAYTYRFVVKKDAKMERVIAVSSRRVRDVDGPDPDAFAVYHFLEETRRTRRGVQDKTHEIFGKVMPELDKLIKRVRKILEESAADTQKKDNEEEK